MQPGRATGRISGHDGNSPNLTPRIALFKPTVATSAAIGNSPQKMLTNLISRLPPGTTPVIAAKRVIRFAPLLTELANTESGKVFGRMKTAADGLTAAEAARRLDEVGPNIVVSEKDRKSVV